MASDNSVLIALGGNALILPGEKGYIEEQFAHTDACTWPIAELIGRGLRPVITHGNGPIVGNILLQNECAKAYIPPMPLYICVADSQGGIGAMVAESLGNGLGRLGVRRSISTVITHVVVHADDPAFGEFTKPVGPYYSDDAAQRYMEGGWKMRKVAERGWRRLVPSPRPQRIVEIETVATLFRSGIIPIASGGGGIPVIEEGGLLKGIDAVIDKDLSAGLLAHELGIERSVVLTDVDGVYLGWGTKDRERLASLTVEQAKRYLFEGQFPVGSMGPKIDAAVRFLESGGKEVLIAGPQNLIEAWEGRGGTRIVC